MKRLFTILLVCCSTVLFSQPCLPEGITFTSQEQIDNFQVNYPGCTEISGNLKLTGAGITNLTGLNVITAIGGDLDISGCNSLINLVGLDALDSIGGNLEASMNDNLINFEGLESSNYLGGDLYLWGNHDLINLVGLEGLTEINGSIDITLQLAMTSLSGLENLTYVQGSVSIEYNEYLVNLDGLQSLTSIGGGFFLDFAESLTNINGLNNLQSVGSNFTIYHCPSLNNLEGLNNLTFIGAGLFIASNTSLNNFLDLSNLTSINGEIHIGAHDSLTSLSGLDNINPGSISGLAIIGNSLLTECDVQSICDYLVSPAGTIDIHSNGPGCNSQSQIEIACVSCLPEGITFTTQEQIDSFQVNYPGCTEIEGSVYIGDYEETNITNLDGIGILSSIGEDLVIQNTFCENLDPLSNLASIEWSLIIKENENLVNISGLGNLTGISVGLEIMSNDQLLDLTGLENITSLLYVWIGSHLWGGNANLANLVGLENLTNIVGDLEIYGNLALFDLIGLNNLENITGDMILDQNVALNNLTGLESLTELGGSLIIKNNPQLNHISALSGVESIGGELRITDNSNIGSLSGLESIDPYSIFELYINENESLNNCDVLSICEYLANPNGTISIFNNNYGCNNEEQILMACEITDTKLNNLNEIFTISPIPTNKWLSIKTDYANIHYCIEIKNLIGQLILIEDGIRSEHYPLDISDLRSGVYFYRIKADGEVVQQGKLIKK